MSTFFGTQSVPNLFQNWRRVSVCAVRIREWCGCGCDWVQDPFPVLLTFLSQNPMWFEGVRGGGGLHWCEHFRIKGRRLGLEGWFSGEERWLLFQRAQVRFLASTWQFPPVHHSKIRHRNTCKQNTSTHKIKMSSLEKEKGRRVMILRNKGTSWRSVVVWKGSNLNFAKTFLPC